MNKPKSRDNAATAWLIRLSASDVSEQEIADFQQWLAKDIRNQKAFIEAEQVWQTSALLRQPKTQSAKKGAWIHVGWPGAAIAALLLMVITVFVVNDEPAGQTHWQVNTQVGEQKELALPDGTRVYLNTNSEIEVSYLPSKRTVIMSKGEVFFKVAKNPDAPFEVTTDSGTVRVLGTQFAIKLADKEPSVTVLEGRVALLEPIAEQNAKTNIRVELTANQKAPLNSHRPQVEKVEAAALTSWRNKVLMYREARLEEIIADLNRYFSKDLHLQVSANQLENWPKTSAVIQLQEEQATIHSVASSLGLALEVDEAGHRYVLKPLH